MANGISVTDVDTQINTHLDDAETTLMTDLGALDPETATAADYLAIQIQMQKWSTLMQLQSNVIKTMGDGFKNTVSNVR